MNCYVGVLTGEQCHKQDYQKVPKEVIKVSELSEDDQKLLKLRISNEIDSICHYHKYKYFVKFHHIFGKKRCDPLQIHKKPIKNGLRKILLQHLSKPTNLPVDLIPGKSLCPKCSTKLFVQKTEEENIRNDNDDTEFNPHGSLINNKTLEGVDTVCKSLNLLPVHKMMKLNKDQRHTALMKKTEKISIAVKRKLEETFSENLEENTSDVSTSYEDEYAKLLSKLKEKCKVANKAEKVKIISLLPDSWSRTKISKEFNVSEYLVQQTRELVKEQGILPNIFKREGHKLNEQVINCVTEFYQDDIYSRLCPAKKDYVSMGKVNSERLYKQKRLILFSLNELYALFKEKYSEMKIGRSKFCSLRPKWCVLPGSSGTHSVCVCKYHQNVKLMIEAAKINASYKDLLKLLVCDMNKESCMFNKCSECPGKETLLLDTLNQRIDEMPEEICFKQWVNTDRAESITQVKATDEFLESLVEQLLALKTHHFISKTQSKYFQELKETSTQKECVVLADFAENYTFTIQDEIQSYHWNNQQATIHPFVYYFKNEDKLCYRNLCVISDHLVHDAVAVYNFQKCLIDSIKKTAPSVEKLIYFTDGSSSQYKNKKNFVNVCHHIKDFGMQAEWNFFASSHGKNACDGIGGMTKRETTRVSLQRPYSNQILTAKDMFDYCSQNISGVTYQYVSSREIEGNEKKLENRFQFCQRVPGTRTYHRFLPINESVIRCYAVSTCEQYYDHTISKIWETALSFKNNDYVACIYDENWWIGKVLQISEENNDLYIQFFHPCGPKTSFQLAQNDMVWVPISKVLRKLTLLELTTITGRSYNITEALCNEISELFVSVSGK